MFPTPLATSLRSGSPCVTCLLMDTVMETVLPLRARCSRTPRLQGPQMFALSSAACTRGSLCSLSQWGPWLSLLGGHPWSTGPGCSIHIRFGKHSENTTGKLLPSFPLIIVSVLPPGRWVQPSWTLRMRHEPPELTGPWAK